jgi:hypothetical protein
MTFQEIIIIATGPCITNQLRDVNTICRKSWYIAAHIICLLMCDVKVFLTFTFVVKILQVTQGCWWWWFTIDVPPSSLNLVLLWQLFYLFCSSIVIHTVINKGNSKITKLRTIFQWESQNSQVYKQTKSVNNRKTENRNDPDLVQAFLKNSLFKC